MTIESILPRVRHLIAHGTLSNANDSDFSKLKHMLARCSTVLETLELGFTIYKSGYWQEYDDDPDNYDGNYVNERDESNSRRNWTSLKKLSLLGIADHANAESFWEWLCERCIQVETLEIFNSTASWPEFGTRHGKSLSNIVNITMGGRLGSARIPEDEVGAVLAGPTKGWRVVDVKNTADFGREAMEALSMNFSTLKVLTLDIYEERTTEYLVEVLSCSPKLRIMVDSYVDHLTTLPIDAKVFIDQDPITGTLRTWTCEATLRTFVITLAGIPRRILIPALLSTKGSKTLHTSDLRD
ncbi:hypothetical protein BGX31_001741 [Mortierella sp. GBA43]|nr:hypothetical protein BGX31_001741 [Mortierella sp. GBA43]